MGCRVHRHRRPVGLTVHHTWPISRGGPSIPANRIVVCVEGHNQIHEYLDLLIKGDGRVSIADRIIYNRRIRAVAEAGYQSIRTRHLVDP